MLACTYLHRGVGRRALGVDGGVEHARRRVGKELVDQVGPLAVGGGARGLAAPPPPLLARRETLEVDWVLADAEHGALLAPARGAVVAAHAGRVRLVERGLGLRDRQRAAHEGRLEVAVVVVVDRALAYDALALERHKVLVADVVDAVDRARVDGLVDGVVAVAALVENARLAEVVLHEEGAASHEGAILAADARRLVDVRESGEHRLARPLVEIQLHVRRHVRVCLHHLLGLLGRARV